MIEVISVRFKDKGKVYFFASNGVTARTGDHVVVQTSKGLEYAECTRGNHFVEDTAVVPPLRPVIRVATEADDRRARDNRRREKEAFDYCQKRISDHKLDMKLVDVEYSFDGGKILFFFTSEGRVDFRDLVKDLAGMFKTRVELRQIGVRDEARMLGGLGICGRPFCCTQFLDDFHPVSIKMAKTQALSLKPTKISGTCGRLMCCLKYEQAAYEDLVKKAPKQDAFVETASGFGSVTGVNLLRGYAKVRMEDSTDTSLKTVPFDELTVLGGKAKRAEYLAAREAGTLEEMGFKVYRRELKAALSSPAPAPAAAPEAEPKHQKSRSERRAEHKKQQQEQQGRSADGKKQENRRRGKGQKPPKPQNKPQQNQAGKQNQGGKQQNQIIRPQKEPNGPAPRRDADPDIRAIAAEAAREAAKGGGQKSGSGRRRHRGGRGRGKRSGGEAPKTGE